MRHLFFAVLLALFSAVSCGDGATRVIQEAEADSDKNQSEKGDSEEISDNDEVVNTDEDLETPKKDDENSADTGSDTDPDKDGQDGDNADSGEGGQDEDENTVHEDRTVSCTGLPENAEWNTASVITQTWQNGGYVPSEVGSYSKEKAPSTFETTTPEAAEPSLPQCPEGTNDTGGVCQIDNCGAFAFRNTISHSTLCGVSSNGQKMCLKDKTMCYKTEKDANSQQNQVPCCCDSEIYDVRWGYSLIPPIYEATELTTDGFSVKTSEMFSCHEPVPCPDGFEYGEETKKCYECPGEFTFDAESGKYQCSTEIGKECRFKCKEHFSWNGEKSVCEPAE
ncbi:hypothetical protein J6Z19_08910 [bacterium]|nr:hypothetical protein [bacterium]